MYRATVIITPSNGASREVRTASGETMTEAVTAGLEIARAAWIAHEMTIRNLAVNVSYRIALPFIARGN
jgi:hypothetical protein